MTTIDPTTCKPGEAYMVRVDGRESIAVRLDDDSRPWWITAGWRSDDLNTWHPDSAVTVLHRLVPEPEEKERDQVIAAHQRAEARATLHREERDEARAAVAREADIWHHLSLAAGGPVGTHGDAVDAIASLRRETDQAGAAELRVRLLHSPVDCRGTDEQRCQECISEQWPCPTIRAFDGEA